MYLHQICSIFDGKSTNWCRIHVLTSWWKKKLETLKFHGSKIWLHCIKFTKLYQLQTVFNWVVLTFATQKGATLDVIVVNIISRIAIWVIQVVLNVFLNILHQYDLLLYQLFSIVRNDLCKNYYIAIFSWKTFAQG